MQLFSSKLFLPAMVWEVRHWLEANSNGIIGSGIACLDLVKQKYVALACVTLVVLQETEGELFKRKSQWSEGYAAFMEFWSRVISFFTLWKTSIQRVEGKHG